MYLSDSEDEKICLIIKFSNKKVTFNEKKNRVIIFNAEEPPRSKYGLAFLKKWL